MLSLRDLELHDNKLTNLPANYLLDMPHLQQLRLDRNPLRALPALPRSLRVLHLEGCPLEGTRAALAQCPSSVRAVLHCLDELLLPPGELVLGSEPLVRDETPYHYDATLAHWLALRPEAPLEPRLAICDPHHHLWGPERGLEHGQVISHALRNAFGERCGVGPYAYDDFAQDAAANNVVSSVFIECGAFYQRRRSPAEPDPGPMAPVAESRGVAAVDTHGRPMAIVAHADLRAGAAVVRPVLEAHAAAAGSRLAGLRHLLAWDASEHIYSALHRGQAAGASYEPAFREAFALLAEFGLVYDVWLFHTNLAELQDLALAFPQQPIVLNHVGFPLGVGPYTRETSWEPWRAAVSRLAAACPNVHVKLSGLTMPVCGFGWEHGDLPPSSEELAAALQPYLAHCLAEFGVDRCMFASNFPPDQASCSYTVLWNAFKRVAQALQLSPADQVRVFCTNAERMYFQRQS